MERLHRQTKTERERERERKATEFRLHANSSNLLSNSSLSLCLFRSLFFFFIDLSNFYSNQTKPNQTKPQKKFFQIPENKLQEIYFLLILVLHSLQPITKKAHTHLNFLFFILINNNNIKKFIYINIVVGACGFLRVRYVLVMGSHRKSNPRPPSSSSPSSSQPADVAISGKRFFLFFFPLFFCYYLYMGFRKVSAFNMKHWFFVLVS